jgi:CHAD domain-containing protein
MPSEGLAMESLEPAAAAAPNGHPAGKLLARRVREMFRVFPKALVGDVEAVHDLRVAARRLRSALTLFAFDPDGRRARRADRTLGALARAAGRGRDLDVGIEILEALPAGRSEASERLRRALRASRARTRALAREELLDLGVAHLRRDLRELIASAVGDRGILAERLVALRRKEEGTIDRELSGGRGRPHPDRLHRARRAARRLRYAAELEELLDGSDTGEAARWRAMQTDLGDIQDRHVLGAWLTRRERKARRGGDAALASVAHRAHSRVKADAARRTRAFLAGRTPQPVEPAV